MIEGVELRQCPHDERVGLINRVRPEWCRENHDKHDHCLYYRCDGEGGVEARQEEAMKHHYGSTTGAAAVEDSEARKKKRPVCSECGRPIGVHTRTGICAPCAQRRAWKSRDGARKRGPLEKIELVSLWVPACEAKRAQTILKAAGIAAFSERKEADDGVE